jgi:Rrf2 family protein
MLELAKNFYKEENRIMELSKIAKAQNLSLKYIEHIISDLRKQGLVESVRGVAGGYRLYKAPDKISLYDILQASENIGSIVKCVHKKSTCSFIKLCGACDVWEGIQKAIVEHLKTKNLSDIVRSHEIHAGQKVMG